MTNRPTTTHRLTARRGWAGAALLCALANLVASRDATSIALAALLVALAFLPPAGLLGRSERPDGVTDYTWALVMTGIAAAFGATLLVKGDGGVVVPAIVTVAGAAAFAVFVRRLVILRAADPRHPAP